MSTDNVQPQTDPGFAPRDYSDSRLPGEWKSIYPEEARTEIRKEVGYLCFLLVVISLGILLAWLRLLHAFCKVDPRAAHTFSIYIIGTLAGALGGTLFSAKWLYHSIAKRLWHLDRRLWRVSTPLISGGLAFAVLLMVNSRLFGVFDPNLTSSLSRSAAVGFLVGFFSDNTVAKLAEVAESIFGTTKSRANESPERR